VVLIIDELGKFLEFAAADPERGDIFILQLLAEATGSSDTNLLLITLLHQAFERYASNLAAGQRAEWAKIQGRFEDVAFRHRQKKLSTSLLPRFSSPVTRES
jgi:hypothetical protein